MTAGLAGVVCSPQEVAWYEACWGRWPHRGARHPSRHGRAGRSGQGGHRDGRGGGRCDSSGRRAAGAPGLRSGSRIPGVSRGGSLRGILMGWFYCWVRPRDGLRISGWTRPRARARQAWLAHDAVALVADSPRLLVQLPGADPSVALGSRTGGGAAAGLPGAGPGGGEARSSAAREVEPGRGYVELQRWLRIAGTQDVRVQSLLRVLAGKAGWVLVELRVVG